MEEDETREGPHGVNHPSSSASDSVSLLPPPNETEAPMPNMTTEGLDAPLVVVQRRQEAPPEQSQQAASDSHCALQRFVVPWLILFIASQVL